MIPARRLLLSIHDVTAKFLPQIERLRAHLVEHGGAASVALLVIPDHWGDAPIAHDPRFKAWLRARHVSGDEVILHGWSHRADSKAATMIDRFRGRHMTAGEGEFLALTRAEAGRRLHDGRALLQDIIGAPVSAFVAPAWLYGDGARLALADEGFDLAEDHFRVWRPTNGRVMARGPVVSWATRSRARTASSLAFAAAARPLLRRASLVRIATHPGDCGAPAVMNSIATTVRHFRQSHRPAAYRDLLQSVSTDCAPQEHL